MADQLPNADISQFDEATSVQPNDWAVIYQVSTGRTLKTRSSNFGLDSPSSNYNWSPTYDYAVDEVVEYQGALYKSLTTPNVGNVPNAPGSTAWEALEKSGTSSLAQWAAGAYLEDEVYVLKGIDGYDQLFKLASATRPYVSANLELEYAAGDWALMSERGYYAGTKATHGFAINDVLTFKAGAWNKFTTGDTPLGIVRIVVDVNTFVVSLMGQLLKGLTGLTAGSKYYAQADATISTTLSDTPVWLAVSATEAVLLAAGGGGTGSQNLTDVLTEGNDAGGLQIKNVAAGSVASDVVILSQMTAAIAAAVTGVLDYRGGFSAAGGAWPTSAAGGSGPSGAILKADLWVITTGGTLTGGIEVEIGDWIIAKIDAAGNTSADWDVINKNVVLATGSVAGIMKLYSTTGSNTDGTITQAAITAALNLKADQLWSITTKTGSYTMGATELAQLILGVTLVMEGNGTGALGLPANATTAFLTGHTFAARSFLTVDASAVTGAGGTVTGTNGTLDIPVGKTVLIEKKGTNTWILHNGSPAVTNWSTTEVGVSEESTQAEAENVANGANTSSMTGIGQGRGFSEISMYYFIRKVFTLAWTWAIGPIITDATASTPAMFNGSKKLVSNAFSVLADWITGTDTVKQVTVASFLAYRKIRLTALTVVPGTPNLLTIDAVGAVENCFNVVAAITSNFTVNWLNHTDLQYAELWIQINGTVVITFTNGTSGQPNIVSEDADLRYASKALTITTASAKYIRITFTRQTTGATGIFSMEVSTPIAIS